MRKLPIFHHYIPQYYLKGFSTPEDSSQVWAFEKETKRGFCANTSRVAQERYFYAIKDERGNVDKDSIEQFLANNIEGPAVQVIDKLKRLLPITVDEKLQFAQYITYMFSRVPQYRERISKRLSVFETRIKFAKDQQTISDTSNEDLQTVERALKYAPDMLKQLLQLPHFFPEIFKALVNMNWAFLTRQEPPYFLTSDNPFIFTERRGLRNEKAEIIFPVSKNVLLWATWKIRDFQFRPLEGDKIQIVNKYIASYATRFLFYFENAAWIYDLL